MTPKCTCIMDGSYRFSCPQHGVRNSLIDRATDHLHGLSNDELRALIARPENESLPSTEAPGSKGWPTPTMRSDRSPTRDGSSRPEKPPSRR